MLRVIAIFLLMVALKVDPALAIQPIYRVVESAVQPLTVGDNSLQFKARILNQRILPATVILDEPLSSIAGQQSAVPPGTPRMIGEGRDVVELHDVVSTRKLLQWQSTPNGGAVGAITISASQARGSRIGLLVQSLPTSAIVRFYAPNSDTAFEVSGASILNTLKQNLDAGDESDAGHTYWGPPIEGGQTLTGIYKAPSAKGNVSSIHLACSSSTTCNLTWAGGTVPVQKYIF